MKGTPEQIDRAEQIKAQAMKNASKLISNSKVLKSISKFANSRQDARWWIAKSASGEHFLIIEHQKKLIYSPERFAIGH